MGRSDRSQALRPASRDAQFEEEQPQHHVSNGVTPKKTTKISNTSEQRQSQIAERKEPIDDDLRSVNNNHGNSMSSLTDFFSNEVFHLVLHNPTTAHRFLRFCQSRACGENIEFLQKVSAYSRLLDDMATALGSIHTEFIAPGAPNQLNISQNASKRVSSDLKQATIQTLPGLEQIFAGVQNYIEQAIASDIYPRFVKHQITASASVALATDRQRFSGLGDCFCLTDPRKADNPILYASDGFVSVTGYSRKDIIPRNCRFLQGRQTDPNATKRLRMSIEQCEETVELLLNYRKNGDPFWNLLYCSPLFNERGDVAFFLGGQINCSTTIHSCTDVLKVLSVNDDELDQIDAEAKRNPSSIRSQQGIKGGDKPRSSFFKSWRKYKSPATVATLHARDEVGMEGELLNRVGKLNFKTQVEAFYTAYSKYLVLNYNSVTQTSTIQFFSPGVIDMLCLNLPNGTIAPVHNKDIFLVLSEHTASPSASAKALKQTIRPAIKEGKAVSVEIGLLTGFAEKKARGGFFGGKEERDVRFRRVEEQYVTHWTPLKDEVGNVKWIVLTIAPKL